MSNNPCGVYEYNSDEYNSCVKDIVFENAQDEWIMLDPRFPNLKGVTPNQIDNILSLFRSDSQKMKEYCIDYLNHIMTYDRDDIFKMCLNLGEQIEKQYPGKLHEPHSIFITTPRGGHEVLSIFSYANDLNKEQIPSNIKSISDIEYTSAKENITEAILAEIELNEMDIEISKYVEEGNLPIIPDIWLPTVKSYSESGVKTVFIVDDIIASGQQMHQAFKKVSTFFGNNVEIIPVVLCKRKDIEQQYGVLGNTIYDTEIVGIDKWDISQRLVTDQRSGFITPKPELIEDFDKIISVRFPWGSPDGMSDAIAIKLYEGRRGLDRMERKQTRCILEPDKCELK